MALARLRAEANRRTRLLVSFSGLAASLAVAGGFITTSDATASDVATKRYAVVFNDPNRIPPGGRRGGAAEAGGTIVTRIEQIRAAGVESANPNVIAAMRRARW